MRGLVQKMSISIVFQRNPSKKTRFTTFNLLTQPFVDRPSFLSIYQSDPIFQTLAHQLSVGAPFQLQVKGLSGSLDMVLLAAYFEQQGGFHLVVAQDKEEAAYLNSDLHNLLGSLDQRIFPSSYKRPYHYEEIDNANVLQRAELLNQLLVSKGSPRIVISYPEALYEKVINKRSLVENTFTARVGEAVDMEFITEILSTYDFERTDFVYEPGQFAIRGGILDVFSFSNEFPYRLELVGKEIESIRTFDPETQLSLQPVPFISLIPNVQTRLLQELRQSFLSFLPEKALLWIKDYQLTLDVMNECYLKAAQAFGLMAGENKKGALVLQPELLFEQGADFVEAAKKFSIVEFGRQFYLKNAIKVSWESQPQPSFNKNFDLLVANLGDNEKTGFLNLIVAENEKQIDRLQGIFQELDPSLQVQSLLLSLREGFVDKQAKLVCYTDHQLFERFHRYKSKSKSTASKALTLKEIKALHPGDYVVHVDYGVGRFAGLEKVDVSGNMQEAVRLVFRDDDLLYINIHSLHKISKYSGQEGQAPSMSKLGSPDWENKKARAKKQVKDIAKDLIALYAKRRSALGFAFSRDSVLQVELESSFIYEDTPDQAASTADVKADMEKSYPMDRLVCGDVGFGKTEVAIRAAFKAVNDRKQVAILVPTTILAMQHYQTLSERLENFPVKVDYLNRFRSSKDIKSIKEQVTSGEIDILIGTHKIVSKDMEFRDLGLLIIDEEQKFGVKVKDQLKNLRVNVDVLTLTATPIPRTLHFSLMGARDLSVIATPPPNRQPVTTEVQTFEEEVIRDAVSYELRRGGQVFFVHNRVGEIDSIANLILKLVPDARVIGAHGQMDGDKLEKIMVDFINHKYDVLVSTNIIESGLDIPNANTILINRAHMFGLSDLHQMRGRVGRSNKKAFCYLLTSPLSGLTAEARKRLQTLEEFSDLGDGFKVAMKDLDIRGAGNLLGSEQSGFITDLGFEMYHKILDEAVRELKENEFAALFEEDLKEKVSVLVQDCTIETDLELLIPESYVNNISERLGLYSKLDALQKEDELDQFGQMLQDRFGPAPQAVQDLMETVRLRWQAEELGIEKLVLKASQMKCYLLPSSKESFYNSPIFGNIMKFAQLHPKSCKIKEHKNRLILSVDQVLSIQKAQHLLKEMKIS